MKRIDCSHGTVLARGGGLAVYDARTGARLARYPVLDPITPGRGFMITGATRDERFRYAATTAGHARVNAP